MTTFMGKTTEEWLKMEKFFYEYSDIINTPEGQLLAARGRLRNALDNLEATKDNIENIQSQIKKLEAKIEKST